MSQETERDAANGPSKGEPEPDSSWTVLRWLLVAATGWYLLKELAPFLRPLFLAMFLAYIVLPIRVYLQGQMHRGVRHLLLLTGLGVALVGLSVLAYGDILELSHNVPRLHDRTKEIFRDITDFTREHIPALDSVVVGTASAEEQASTRLREALEGLANVTAGVLVEAIQVVFYLALILVEANRLPKRVRAVFPDDQALQLLSMIGAINTAMASYLKVKIRANLVLAIPVMLVLALFGVKFVLLWGVLTFFANFVPYLGSVVACALPILYALLDRGLGWQTISVAVLLPGIHVCSAYLVEPAMTGKAVDLNPLVVLIALSFWGLCWGLTGMVLAVPLTAMLKIILESTPNTRPTARLMGSE
jgi:AI-2 transport protein TqsA